MNNLHPMSEKPDGYRICIFTDAAGNPFAYERRSGIYYGIEDSQGLIWKYMVDRYTGWRYLNENDDALAIENDKLSKMISQFKVFAKIVFAHLYGEITKDVCEWRGDHLSRSNIELISEIKEHLKVKP